MATLPFNLLPHFSLTDKYCISSKCSFLQKNIRKSQPACEDCALPDEEGKGMKVDIFGEFSKP